MWSWHMEEDWLSIKESGRVTCFAFVCQMLRCSGRCCVSNVLRKIGCGVVTVLAHAVSIRIVYKLYRSSYGLLFR